jgi:hypothetical protein
MPSIKIIILIVFVIMFSTLPVFAGECLETQEYYLKQLAGVDPKSGEGIDSCFNYTMHFEMASYTGFSESDTSQNTEKSANDPLKNLALRLLPPFLKSPSEEVRCNTARALASYHWPGIYEHIMACPMDVHEKAAYLAVLGDKRARPWIVNQYKDLYMKEGRKAEMGIDETVEKWMLLNTLYPFASPEILPFINTVIKDNKNNYDVKARAIKIRKRIYELYPETKPKQ